MKQLWRPLTVKGPNKLDLPDPDYLNDEEHINSEEGKYDESQIAPVTRKPEKIVKAGGVTDEKTP